MKKSIIAILTTAVMILSFLGPALYSQTVAYALVPDPEAWYMQVDGVLDTDYYSLYPYEAKSLSIGLSKYGEFINNVTNVGLEYGGERDPWAAPAGPDLDPYGKLPKKVWINGWYIDITYNHSSWGVRNLWAGAMFGDLSSQGKPWLRVSTEYGSCTYEWQENFLRPGFEVDADGDVVGSTLQAGGRKTNGTAVTEPITLLYHGPRSFIAFLVTHIWDWEEQTGERLHIVDVMFTVIFNKVKKEVIVLKEVKVVDQAKYQISSLTVRDNQGVRYDIPFGILCQFSNREEWDLGTPNMTPKYASYVHFYTTGTAPNDMESSYLYTVYDNYWTVIPTLPTNITILLPNANRSVNAYGPEPTNYIGDTFDLAQIISNDEKYVGFAAYWPSLSDWSADAGGGRRNIWWRAIGAEDPHDIDSFATPNDEPFLAPLTVGEWDFMLSDDHREVGPITTDVQFRGVSVFGLTDLNDGDDYDINEYGHENIIDREVWYQLDEVFNPWSLCDYHDMRMDGGMYHRWVTKHWGDGIATRFYLYYADLYPDKPWIYDWPYVYEYDFNWGGYYDWGYYCEFEEKVLVDGVLMKPWDNDWMPLDYEIWYDGQGYVYVEFAEPPAEDALIKILFSTYWGNAEWITVGRNSAAIDSAGATMVGDWMHAEMSALDMNDTQWGPDAPFIFDPLRPELLPGRSGYRDAEIDFNEGRLALKDDWSCHLVDNEWMNGLPISSSDIIAVGGPYANAATEYLNDFTDVLFTLGGWTGPGLPTGEFFSRTCWDKMNHLYVGEYDAHGRQTTGYGVITTYKDINGTTWLLVYGYSGQDTYYTSWSLLHSDVLDYAMHYLHPGVTTLILEFDYTLHPTDFCFVTIVEALGTISELDFRRLIDDGIMPDDGMMPLEYWPEETWILKFPTIHPDP